MLILWVFISFTKEFFTFHSNRVKCEKQFCPGSWDSNPWPPAFTASVLQRYYVRQLKMPCLCDQQINCSNADAFLIGHELMSQARHLTGADFWGEGECLEHCCCASQASLGESIAIDASLVALRAPQIGPPRAARRRSASRRCFRKAHMRWCASLCVCARYASRVANCSWCAILSYELPITLFDWQKWLECTSLIHS